MTFVGWMLEALKRSGPFVTPRASSSLKSARPPRPDDISVVVPVLDNQRGIDRLCAWLRRVPEDCRPAELVIVDDGSSTPIQCDERLARVIRTSRAGPAAARNAGWRAARAEWVAFTDSDCIPSERWLQGFAECRDGEIAAQGRVRALARDWLSSYYDSQQVLRPMSWTRDGRPGYLITANALVHRMALERAGGFSERFRHAAGEDVDLGIRLAELGELRWCPDAVVAHDFEPSFVSFVRRFVRYGRGNRMLANGRERRVFRPRPFMPLELTATNSLLSAVAFLSLSVGWVREGLERRIE